MGNITKMLPFLEEEDVNVLAKKILESEAGEWKGVKMSNVLPFLSAGIVDEMCLRCMEKGKSYKEFLPFISEEGMHKIITDVLEGRLTIELDAMYPFMNEGDIKRVFYFYLEKEE